MPYPTHLLIFSFAYGHGVWLHPFVVQGLARDVWCGELGISRAQLSGSMPNLVRATLVSSGFRHGSVTGIPLLLVSFLVELIQVGVSTAVLEVSILEEPNPLGLQAPGSLTIAVSLHEFSLMLCVRIVLIVHSNREMSAANVVSREGCQVGIDCLTLLECVLVSLHCVRCQGRSVASNINSVCHELFLVCDTIRGVTSLGAKGVLVADLVISHAPALVCPHVEVRLERCPGWLFWVSGRFRRSPDSGGRNLTELSRVLA
jgi:hypothetical protein